MILEDKLYKSSEVCSILGVSLRTLYRYIEDGKLESVQLASGRHRFTKDQVEKFLSLGMEKKPIISEQSLETPYKKVEPSVKDTADTDFLTPSSVLDSSAIVADRSLPKNNDESRVNDDKLKMGLVEEEPNLEVEPTPEAEVLEENGVSTLLSDDSVFKPMYFKCPFDDLKVVAKLIKRAGENASADYAFTGPAGLSLFYPIKSFDKLHIYVSPDQVEFWKLRLQLEEITMEESNLILIKADSVEVFQNAGERGGLKHVSISKLKDDLKQLGMVDELKEFESKGY